MDPLVWNNICDSTQQSMREHGAPFLSPIWKIDSKEDETSHGTGSYFGNGNRKFLITNEHVAKAQLSYRLTHSFHCSENILLLTNKFLCAEAPVDVAISEIQNSVWDQEVCQGQAIPLHRFAKEHKTVNGELLFFAGFSGERSKSMFGTMVSRGTTFLTAECPLPGSVKEANPEYHLSIPYPTELVRTADPSVPFPKPPGLSGSLLWNTKRIACLQKNEEWDPSMAEVTGLIWGWPSAAVCILATKVEHLCLQEMVEAYDSMS